jgi:hypothetical protein
MEVQVKAAGKFTAGCGGWLRCLPLSRERRGGPHHLRLGKGRGRGAGRVQPWAAPPPGQQSPHADCTFTDDNPGHDHQYMEQLTHGGHDGPATAR